MWMRDSFTVDETDLKIVEALQVQPRAPWTTVAATVGIDPATAARRWKRLTDAGAAWISCYPPLETSFLGAIVELDCRHGRIVEVANLLAEDPHAMTVNISAGGRDILLEVVARTPRDLSRYVLGRLAAVSGIRRVRTHPIVNVYRDASQWRLGALGAAAERRLGPARIAGLAPTAVTLTDPEWAVATALGHEPRIGVAALAEVLGVSPATARRRLDRHLDSQTTLRCELARPVSGWPIHATFFADCPADRLESTARTLSQLPEVRGVMSIGGAHNLFAAVWLRSLADVQTLEAELAEKLPHLSIADRALVIRPVKLLGKLLDEDGWAVRTVPIDIRRSPLAPLQGQQ